MKQLINILLNIIRYALVIAVIAFPLELLAQNQDLAELISRARAQGVEQTALQELQKRAESRGITDKELIQIIEPAVVLAEKNLPSEMILQKALEGLSKSVPGQKLIPVLQNMQSATQRAAPVVDPWIKKVEVQKLIRSSKGGMAEELFRNELIKAVSRGMMDNVPPGIYANLMDEISTEAVLSKTEPSGVIAAVGVMSDLGMASEQPETTKDFVIRSLKAGFETSELQRLPMAMKAARQRGQLPAGAVIEGVSRQLDAGIPAKQILQNLFEGNIGGGPPGGTPPGLEKRGNRGHGNNGGGQGNGG